jgi:transketolase N-terminal domain/subunit
MNNWPISYLVGNRTIKSIFLFLNKHREDIMVNKHVNKLFLNFGWNVMEDFGEINQWPNSYLISNRTIKSNILFFNKHSGVIIVNTHVKKSFLSFGWKVMEDFQEINNLPNFYLVGIVL